MAKDRILQRAAFKKQRASVVGIFLLLVMVSLCLFSSLTLSHSGEAFVSAEMERLGFGNFTAWVSGQPNSLAEEIEAMPDVAEVSVQPLIFAGYEINGSYSDNEGQLIVYDGSVPYAFLSSDGSEIPIPVIEKGTVYISPALQSSFDVHVGDTIQFEFSRSNGIVSLVVAGYFGDAFMGSSMIDMKSFLICEADQASMLDIIASASEADVLGKDGAMLHIWQSEDSELSDTDFHKLIQSETDLPLYTEFIYQQESILSYMLLLQNILTGFLFSFSVVLLIICLIIISNSLSSVVEQDKRDMAILKTMGLSGGSIRSIYLKLYGGTVLLGILVGGLPAFAVAKLLAKVMLTSTGLAISIRFPIGTVTGILLGLLVVFALFLYICTARIMRISPMQTLRESGNVKSISSTIHKKYFGVAIAIRELLSGKRKYLGLCIISILLVLFLSVIGRMGSWLGPNGEGMMNAFSVAEHDLGVQPFNDTVPMDEIERVIAWYSPIQETYELAMESVTVNGQEYTANVLNDTSYFHILQGVVCGGDEILITDTVASEQGLSIGDTVQVASAGRMETYTVSGIYQCANGMGSNIGMSMAGYSKIGDITGFIWCYHYILENGGVRDYAMKYLQDSYRGIDVHTNSWSGLSGIVSVMHSLIAVIYFIATILILITVALTASKLLQAETGNMAIYKSLGLSTTRLRQSFSFRFLIVAFIGASVGSIASAIFADTIILHIFRSFGIGEFSSGFNFLGVVLPMLAIPILFFGAAWLFSAKLKQVSIVKLISENDV